MVMLLTKFFKIGRYFLTKYFEGNIYRVSLCSPGSPENQDPLPLTSRVLG